MEKKVIRCPFQLKEKIVEYYSLFGYQLIEEKNIPFSRDKLVFTREKCDEKIKQVEQNNRLYPFFTFVPAAIGCLIILVLATLFMVFTLKGGGERFSYFLYFMLPAFCVLPLVAIFTIVRYRFDSKNIQLLSNLHDIKKALED